MTKLFEGAVLTSIRLTDNQKKVLTRILNAPTEQLGYEAVTTEKKAITAGNILSKLGLLTLDAANNKAIVTDAGKEVMRNENLIDDSDELTDEGNEFAFDAKEDDAAVTEGYPLINKISKALI